MATRCSKHKMYYEPCSICAEINQLKMDLKLHKEHIAKLDEQGLFQYEKRTKLEEELSNERQEVLDLKVIRSELFESITEKEESIERMYHGFNELEESNHGLTMENIDLQTELDEVSSELEKAINSSLKPERMNPSIRNRLFVQDLNNVRGFLLSYTFLHNTIVQGRDRLKSLSGIELKQWTLFLNEIEEVYERWIDLKNLLINDISNSNWNRLLREVQTIVQKIVTQVNHRNLGHWTLSEEGTVDIEYQIRPLVIKAIETCIHSAGSNNLTAYSKEELIKAVIKIVEEK